MPELSANEVEELHACLRDRAVSLNERELLIHIALRHSRATMGINGDFSLTLMMRDDLLRCWLLVGRPTTA